MLLQFLLPGLGRFLADLRSLHEHFFYFFLAQHDLFLGDGLDPPDLRGLGLGERLLLRQRRVFLEHDFLILLLFFLDQFSPLFRQALADPRVNLLVLDPQLLLEPPDPLLLAFALSLLLLAVFLLLTCYDMSTFSRYLRSHWSSFWLKLRSSSSAAFFLAFSRSFSLGCYFRSSSLAFSCASFLTSFCLR